MKGDKSRQCPSFSNLPYSNLRIWEGKGIGSGPS